MLINSRQNPKIKLVCSLKQKKYRNQLKKYLVEGEKMVAEAFKYGQDVDFILATEKYLQAFCDCGVPVFSVTQPIMEAVSDEVTPQGVIAVVNQPKYEVGLIDKTTVVLDGVSDSGNLGTILRILTAAGISDVFLIDCADCYSPKVVRSSMSGIYNVRCHDIGFDELIQKLKVPLYLADMGGDSIFSTVVSGDFCLVMGSEAHGISQRFFDLKHETVSIPMKGNLESLNVGVATGIILYQLLKNTF